MNKQVDYYMAPISPFSYLGHAAAREICSRHKAELRLHVIDLSKIFPASGGLALKDRAPQRRAYRLVELERWRDHLGVPLVLEPQYFPVAPGLGASVIIAVQQAHGNELALDVAGDLLKAVWADEKDISNSAAIAALLAARGLDANALTQAAAGAEVAQHYDVDTQAALARGIFGAPSYVFEDELFWGQDRLDFLERALAR